MILLSLSDRLVLAKKEKTFKDSRRIYTKLLGAMVERLKPMDFLLCDPHGEIQAQLKKGKMIWLQAYLSLSLEIGFTLKKETGESNV
ncbi:hypothetical protein [Scytonema sp. NUACC21]